MQGKTLLEDVSTEVSGFYSSFPSYKVGRNWWLVLPFPRPPHSGQVTGVTNYLFPCPTHWCFFLSLPFWAVCFLLVPQGSPKGVFWVSSQREADRVFLTLERRGGEEPKKQPPHKLL